MAGLTVPVGQQYFEDVLKTMKTTTESTATPRQLPNSAIPFYMELKVHSLAQALFCGLRVHARLRLGFF